MRRRITSAFRTTTFGTHTALLWVLLAACFVLVCHTSTVFFVFHWGLFDAAYVDVWLVGVLVAAFTIWITIAMRRGATPASGTGFAVAGYGLVCRTAADFWEGFLPWWGRQALPDEPIYDTLDLAHDLGLAAFVIGLAFVLTSSLGELRLRRRAPDWVLPP